MNGMTIARLNPETLAIEGLGQKVFTAGQFAQIECPPCPVCGAIVTIARIDITLNAEDEVWNGRTYIPGMWECPHGCNPLTGQRFHSNQTVTSSMSAGIGFECSCGIMECGLTGVEVEALMAAHPLGQYA